MELNKKDNLIEIKPSSSFVAEVLIQEIKKRGSSNLHPSIMEKVFSFPSDYSDIFYHIGTINFLGGNDKAVAYKGDIEELYDNLCGIVKKYSENIPSLNLKTIDDILLITLLSWGNINDPISKDENEKYLDELIELYLKLKKRKINLSFLTDGKNFDKLLKNEQEDIIYNDEVKVESRMVGGINVNKLIYIPSEYKVAIKGIGKGSKDIILPQRLSSSIYSLIMDEIVQQHKSRNTKFYKMLCNEEFDADKLDKRTRAKIIKPKLRVLNSLVLIIDKYLDSSNKPNTLITAHKHRLIYSVLRVLKFIEKPKNEPEKYIRKLLDDHKPEKYALKQGEKQLFRN